MNDTIIGIIGVVITSISLILATVQTIRLIKLRKIRDVHINTIWKHTKELSRQLLREPEEKYSRLSCGKISQNIEDLIAALILNLFNLNDKKIDKWKDGKKIDDHDYQVLKILSKSSKKE